MKARKAIKRLEKAESLLRSVLDTYSVGRKGLREMLDAAANSVIRAKKSIDPGPAPAAASSASARKPSAKTDQPKSRRVSAKSRRVSAPKSRRLSAQGRKSISVAAKKRWAEARRKGIHPVTGRPLKKTA